VVPQTLGAVAAFLGLVAPGIVFELLRERRRAGLKESVFREASRVALGSLVFTLTSTLLLTGLHASSRGKLFVDVEQWVVTGSAYAAAHVHLVALSVVAELVLACALAVVADLLLAKRGHEVSSVQQQTAWHQVFRRDRPPGTVPWVHAHLVDGTSFFGFLRSHTASGGPDEREIVLEGAELTYVGPPLGEGDVFEERVIGERWEQVVIPSAQIKYVRVQYRDVKTGTRVDSRRRRDVPQEAS